MRTFALIAAALLAGPAAAQAVDKDIATPPTERELSTAADTLSVFVSAFNSPSLGAETKAGLLRCLYGNPLGKLSRLESKIFAENKTANMKSPSQRLYVIAKLCGAPISGAAPATEKK